MDGPRIVVLGAGFAGLRAVRTLARARARVLWIDAHNYHTFQPLLYQVATAGLEPQAIVYPTRGLLRKLPTVEFRMAEIVAGDPEARTLTTATGEHIPYDWLIVATGGSAEDFGIPGVRERAYQLYDLEDARRLRNHILSQLERAAIVDDPEERRALLTFVIVGAGPTGVETAGALAEFRRHVVPADYPTTPPEALRIVLIEAGPHVLSAFAPDLRERATTDLERFGVELHLGTAVRGVDTAGVELANGTRIASRTVVWAAGIRAAAVSARLGLPLGRSDRIRVEPTLAVPGHPRVFAAGDGALVQGDERLPQVAQVAIQSGECAARNVLRAAAGEPLQPFAYRDRGAMATIGRGSAIAQIGRVHLEGIVGWLAWLLLHIVMLVGFRNRLVVLVNWAWNFVTYDRGLRAIVGSGSPPGAVLGRPEQAALSGAEATSQRRVAGGGFEPPTSRL